MQALLDAKPDAIFSSLFATDLARFVREGELRGLFKDRPVFNLLGGEPEYLDPLKDEAPVGWWVTGYPWYAIDTPEHKRFRDAYQAKFNDYPRLGSVVGYSAVKAAAAAIRKAGSTDTEKLVAAMNGLTFDSPFGTVTFRALDHQSTMGAYVGRTAVKDGKGVMVDWRYADGKDYLPSDDDGEADAAARGLTVVAGHDLSRPRYCLGAGSAREQRLESQHRPARARDVPARVSLASFVAQLLNGLAGASALFLVAAGLTLIFGVTRVVNFAHGSLYMLGAYLAYTLVARLRARAARLLGRASSLAALAVALIGALIEALAAEAHLRGAGAAAARRDVRRRADRARRRAVRSGAPEDLLGPRAPGLRGAVDLFGRAMPHLRPASCSCVGPARAARAVVRSSSARASASLIRAATENRVLAGALGIDERALFTLGVRAGRVPRRARRRAAACRASRPTSAWTSRSSPRRSSSPSSAAWARFPARSSPRC